MAGEEMHCGKLEGTGRGQGLKRTMCYGLVRRGKGWVIGNKKEETIQPCFGSNYIAIVQMSWNDQTRRLAACCGPHQFAQGRSTRVQRSA